MEPKYRQEQEWADRIEDPDEAADDETVYRDGSIQNECWAEAGYTRRISRTEPDGGDECTR